MNGIIRLGQICLVLLLTAEITTAQERYVRAQGGYALGIFPQSFAAMGVSQGPSSRMEKASLGTGWSTGIAFGFMFNDHIGVELEAGFFQGALQTFECACQDGAITTSGFQARMVQATPALVLRGNPGAVQPYMRLGAVVGFGSILATSTREMTERTSAEEWKYDGGVSVGVSAGAGVLYLLGERLSLFLEVQYTGAAFAPDRGELTAAREGGESILGSLDRYYTETVFVNEYVGFESAPPPGSQSANEPRRAQRINYKLSSIGIHAGLLLKF